MVIFSQTVSYTTCEDKSEKRNSKFETNPKHESKNKAKKAEHAQFSSFEFRVCFGFRHSDFEFTASAALRIRN